MASRGINKVILIGNAGQDPDSKYLPSGEAVTNISIATSESWKDKNGQVQERTEWHRVVFYKRLAEVVRDYVRKGSKIFVEGTLRSRKWTDKNGQERLTVEVIANEMQMLDSKGAGAPAMGQNFNAGSVDDFFEAGLSTPVTEETVEDELPF